METKHVNEALDVTDGPSFDEIRDEDSLAVMPGCAYGDFSDTLRIRYWKVT